MSAETIRRWIDRDLIPSFTRPPDEIRIPFYGLQTALLTLGEALDTQPLERAARPGVDTDPLERLFGS